jgi:bifunctional non-homologous end joining protein LigD
MPLFADFQHPKLVAEPPAGAAWLHEIKLDGYRLQARIEGGAVTIHTRNGHDWTDKFPDLAEEFAELPDAILDGELCLMGPDGKPTFSGLRAAIGRGRTEALVFFAFDILWRGSDDLRTFALKDRKAALAGVLEAAPSPRIRMVDALPQSGPALLQAACRMGLEGIVSKRREAPYVAGRSDKWVKSKCRPAQEVVIGGWLQEPQRHFKALLVGVYEEGGRLRYVGTVKSGFAKHPGLVAQLEALEAAASPFAGADAPRRTVETRWAEPRLVARVEFAEWTASGKLRQSNFLGLRDDKDPREVVREVAGDVI